MEARDCEDSIHQMQQMLWIGPLTAAQAFLTYRTMIVFPHSGTMLELVLNPQKSMTKIVENCADCRNKTY